MSNQQTPELFDFKLSAEQEERARHLHQESIIVDMLFLGPASPGDFTAAMNEHLKEDYETYHNIERTHWLAQFFPATLAAQGASSIFRELWEMSGVTAGSRECGIGSFEMVLTNLGRINHYFDALPWLVKATRAEDIRRAKAEDRRAGFIHTQDTEAIGQDLDKLNLLYDLGMRIVQLTYNSMNFVGVGCTERVDAGVSNFGLKVIERLNELGMLIDVSHCGRQTTLDACRFSQAPVAATHTGAEAICNHDRCKSDEELTAIAETGGIVGVFTAPAFVNTSPGASMEDFLNHIDYLVNLIGLEHVGLGTDWPNCVPDWLMEIVAEWFKQIGFREEHRVDVLATLKGFRAYKDFINITRGLVSRGYTDHQIKAILGENFLRVFEAVCG